LEEQGITTVEAVLAMTGEELESIQGIGPKTAEKLLRLAREYLDESDREDSEPEAVSENSSGAGDEASSAEEVREASAVES
jgi:Holliday junction resolvasome RuvABC DNA-binding subunit